MQDTYKISVCSCCMIAAVNGEPCTCESEESTMVDDREHPAGLMGKITDGHAVLTSDESYFSWSSCDGCGSTLGGERHDMLVFIH